MTINIKTLVDGYVPRVDFIDINAAADINNLQDALDQLAYATVSQAAFANVETLAANKTLTDNDASIQMLNPNTANRVITLPTAGDLNKPFVIGNTNGGSYTLDVQNASATSLLVIAPGASYMFVSSGIEWRLVGYSGSYQPLDTGLTSLALLGTASNKMLYSTALDTWAEFDTTAFGRGLLNLATGTNGQFLRADGVFSNSLLGQLFIDGATDQIQLRLQGHSTQTTSLQTWEDYAGTVLASVNGAGLWGLGAAPDVASSLSTQLYAFNSVGGATKIVTAIKGVNTPTAATYRTVGGYFEGNAGDAYLPSTYLAGLEGRAISAATGANTLGTAYGIKYSVENRASANINTATGADISVSNYTAGLGTIVTGIGLRISVDKTTGGMTVGYGILIPSLNAVTSYAIYTSLGLVRFGDALSVTMAADRQAAVFTGYTTQTNAIAQITATKTGAGLQELFRITGLGSGANNDGTTLAWTQKTSTTANTLAGALDVFWSNATHANRASRMDLSTYYTSTKQVGLSILGDTGGVKVSLYNGTPVARGAALTAANAGAVNSGDATTDTVINNMRTRINEIEARLGSATGINIFA